MAMKLDQFDRNRSFIRRLLNDFTKGLLELLQKKPLEEITVGELCERVHYPRSTFYNYFEDIYALMDYCWQAISEQMKITEFQDIAHDRRTLLLFNRAYDYMDAHRSIIEALLKHNPADGAMLQSLNKFVRKLIYSMVKECPFSCKYPVPYEMIARHYSNTVQMILSACFLDGQITKAEAESYLEFLLGTIEKESTRR